MQVLWYGIKTGTWSVFRGMWLRKYLILKPTCLICGFAETAQSVLKYKYACSSFDLIFFFLRVGRMGSWYDTMTRVTVALTLYSPRWMPCPFYVLGVKPYSSLLRQSCKLIPVTAVVTLSSVLGFGSTEMFFRSNGSCIHCSSDLVASSRSFIERILSEQWRRLCVCLSSSVRVLVGLNCRSVELEEVFSVYVDSTFSSFCKTYSFDLWPEIIVSENIACFFALLALHN